MIDIDHLRTWIGREDVRSELLTEALAERFNATFSREAVVTDGDTAPTLIHLCLAPPAAPTSGLGADGHPARGGFLPPVPLPRRMWAGGAFTFHADIRVGDVVTRRSTIRDVAIKQGRTGTLCFVTVDHRIESGDRLAVEERQDIVYRDVETSGAAVGVAPAAPHGKHQVRIKPSAPLLFRYSALTFNGHRIHYDAPYARNDEGYPGLVVHGPMQATLLIQFAESLKGRCPRQFGFRSRAPLFDTSDFTLNADEDAEGMRLWTSAVGGPVAMEAQATW